MKGEIVAKNPKFKLEGGMKVITFGTHITTQSDFSVANFVERHDYNSHVVLAKNGKQYFINVEDIKVLYIRYYEEDEVLGSIPHYVPITEDQWDEIIERNLLDKDKSFTFEEVFEEYPECGGELEFLDDDGNGMNFYKCTVCGYHQNGGDYCFKSRDGRYVAKLDLTKTKEDWSREEVIELVKPLYLRAYHGGHEGNCATAIAEASFKRWVRDNM